RQTMTASRDDVYGKHSSNQFNDELMALKTRFLKRGGLVEAQVDSEVKALIEANDALAEEIRSEDKLEYRMEMDIDEEAMLIIARRQPTARDLRLVISVIRMVADLERVGDEAKKIARFAIRLSEEGRSAQGYGEVRHISAHVTDMLHDSLDA